MSQDIGPLTRAAIEAGRLPAELSAETYARIADTITAVPSKVSAGWHLLHPALEASDDDVSKSRRASSTATQTYVKS